MDPKLLELYKLINSVDPDQMKQNQTLQDAYSENSNNREDLNTAANAAGIFNPQQKPYTNPIAADLSQNLKPDPWSSHASYPAALLPLIEPDKWNRVKKLLGSPQNENPPDFSN